MCAAARDRGVLVHVDACAAVGQVPVDFHALGADLLLRDRPQAGAARRASARCSCAAGCGSRPLVVGGAQERARRAGLENVPAIVGFGAAAAELADGGLEREARSRGRAHRPARGRDARHGRRVSRGSAIPTGALPHLVCLGVDGVEAEPILLGLDQAGVAVHSGSSCSSETLEPSPVLAAMGVDADRSLRVSVGWSTVDDDVDAFLAAFPTVVARMRSLRP